MKSLTKRPTLTPTADKVIIDACAAAADAEVNYATKALIAGQLLSEKRHSLMTCHDGKSSWTDKNKPDHQQFGLWLSTHGIPQRTAYRWMECAERVLRLHSGATMDQEWQPYLDVESQVIPYSQVLTLPEADLPERARTLRQNVFEFMEHKSLGEAARAALDGHSPGKRITLAGNGLSKGGTHDHDDRKAFDKFATVKLQHLTTFFDRELTTAQQGRIAAAFEAAMERWPTWILEVIRNKAAAELKASAIERATHNGGRQ